MQTNSFFKFADKFGHVLHVVRLFFKKLVAQTGNVLLYFLKFTCNTISQCESLIIGKRQFFASTNAVRMLSCSIQANQNHIWPTLIDFIKFLVHLSFDDIPLDQALHNLLHKCEMISKAILTMHALSVHRHKKT